MPQCGSRCKINKHIGTCKYGFPNTIFVEQHVAEHLITQRWVKKVQINYMIFALISQILSYLYLCNQQFFMLRETLVLFLQNCSYFEHLFFKIKNLLNIFKT
jgi:hypothetical protein